MYLTVKSGKQSDYPSNSHFETFALKTDFRRLESWILWMV